MMENQVKKLNIFVRYTKRQEGKIILHRNVKPFSFSPSDCAKQFFVYIYIDQPKSIYYKPGKNFNAL